jgi:cyclase
MLKVRVIPVLFLMNGLIVRSEGFQRFQVIGNPFGELERYSEWLADELVYIDITREGEHELQRQDHKVKTPTEIVDILRVIAGHAFMPLTFGGHLRTLAQVSTFIANGADKVVVNTWAYRDPELVPAIARNFGSQAVMVGIDVKRMPDNTLRMFVDQGREIVDIDPVEYARLAVRRGAGEILLNSIDRDGGSEGYDIDAIRRVAEAVNVPVIACGGVGIPEHFVPAVRDGGAAAVAAGNMFHFTENAYKRAKRVLRQRGIDVRYPYPT